MSHRSSSVLFVSSLCFKKADSIFTWLSLGHMMATYQDAQLCWTCLSSPFLSNPCLRTSFHVLALFPPLPNAFSLTYLQFPPILFKIIRFFLYNVFLYSLTKKFLNSVSIMDSEVRGQRIQKHLSLCRTGGSPVYSCSGWMSEVPMVQYYIYTDKSCCLILIMHCSDAVV